MAQNSVVAEGEEMNTLLSEYLNIMSGDGSGLAEEETYTYYIDDLQQGVATTEKTKTYTGLQPSTDYIIKVVVK